MTASEARSEEREFVLVSSASIWQRLTQHFIGSTKERMAFGYCSVVVDGVRTKFILRSLELPLDEEYTLHTGSNVVLGAEKTIRYLLRAKGSAGFVDVHSHPLSKAPRPSITDDLGAIAQHHSLQGPAPESALLRIVLGQAGSVWADVRMGVQGDVQAPIKRIILHSPNGLNCITPNNSKTSTARFADIDRRTLACIGERGLRTTRRLTVGLIGIGGVGAMVARLLASVVGTLILVDPDRLEVHNAPRVWFATSKSRSLKVTRAKRALLKAFPGVRIYALGKAFPAAQTLEYLSRADILFACPDHNAVRYAASKFAASNLQPLIEVGCGGRTNGGSISALGYHVRLQAPGGPCLGCNGLDLSKLEDPLTTRERRLRGYVEDENEIPGELACLTTKAAADAVDVFLRYCTHYAGDPPAHIFGDALRFKTLDLSGSYRRQPHCPNCAEDITNHHSGSIQASDAT